MMKRKWAIIVLSVIFVLITGILYSCGKISNKEAVITLQNQDKNTIQENPEVPTEIVQTTVEEKLLQQETKDNNANDEYIYIHICGEVKNPDVYKVKENSRLIEVITLAGGLTKDAAGDFVNQASLVTDGQRIYIPSKEEVKGGSSGFELSEITLTPTESAGKININTATKEELMTLSGIGEAKADSIIAYRQENGEFRTIEEIKNISGIKDAVFQRISEKITVK